MAELYTKERSLEETSTWAVAVVCLILVSTSLLLEHALVATAKWLKKLHKPALVGALEKIKTELMLMGFISLLLTVGQSPISEICVSPRVAASWLPCKGRDKERAASSISKTFHRRLLQLLRFDDGGRRSLAVAPVDKCSKKGKVAFVSAYGIHQLHYFIFALAVSHVFYCITTYILARTKMRKWKQWEDETKLMEHQDYNDPERSRVAKDTSFGRRHLAAWSQPKLTLWIVCFFRQFTGSVTRVDYRTLRHGFIMAHFAPGCEDRFDFQRYINRSLEEDFKEVVGITPTMWIVALFFLLSNTNGLYAYLWLPFVPLVVALVVGTKLQVIITRMGLRIQEKGEVVKGKLVVEPGDELFWFESPRFVLFLIQLILFQNAFQLAFFIWGWWKFGIESCLHSASENIVIRITMGVLLQVLCSYVTLPLYALVTQMGSSIKPTIFNDRVATALRNWYQTAKKRARDSRHSESVTTPANLSAITSPIDSYHNRRRSSMPTSEPNTPRKSVEEDGYAPESDHEAVIVDNEITIDVEEDINNSQ